MTQDTDAAPAPARATYTAWPLSVLPEWMLADAPGQAAWLAVREPGDAVGWIQVPSSCPPADWTLVSQFVQLVAAAHGQMSSWPTAAMVIYPKGAAAVDFPRPGADGDAFRRECLGRHLISRIQLTPTLAWSGGGADAEPVNVAATDLARSYGFPYRRLHGPVMLCQAVAGTGWNLTVRQLVRLLTLPTTLPRNHQPALTVPGGPGGQ